MAEYKPLVLSLGVILKGSPEAIEKARKEINEMAAEDVELQVGYLTISMKRLLIIEDPNYE